MYNIGMLKRKVEIFLCFEISLWMLLFYCITVRMNPCMDKPLYMCTEDAPTEHELVSSNQAYNVDKTK